MKTKTRTAYPARVAVATNDRRFGRRFWLEIAEYKGKEIIKRGFADAQGKSIEERLIFQEEAKASAELAGNEVKVTSTGAKELRIYLSEKMVDFAKPVIVTVNGRRSTFSPKPSLETLLESERRAPGLFYTASVKVSVP